MFLLYDSIPSGNSYKVRLLLSNLGVTYLRRDVDILAGEARSDEFAKINPLQKVPVLKTSDGRYLAESQRILWFLAQDTRFMPPSKLAHEIIFWFSVTQAYLEPGIARIRFWRKFSKKSPSEFGENYDERKQLARTGLSVLEGYLSRRNYLVDKQYSIADIAVFGYTHLAEDAGFSLGDYPAIRCWIDLVCDQPGYIPIAEIPHSG